MSGISDTRNEDFVNLSAGSCRDRRHGVLADMLFPVWKISKIVLHNYLSFPRVFTCDIPQGYMSKAGGRVLRWFGLHLTSLLNYPQILHYL